MARIRSLKPEFWSDEKTGTMGAWECLLFQSIWNFADDHGVFQASVSLLNSNAFPRRDFPSSRVGKWLRNLIDLELVKLFTHKGFEYGYVVNWQHQRIDKAFKSRFPPRPVDDQYGSNPGVIREQSGSNTGALPKKEAVELGSMDLGEDLKNTDAPASAPPASPKPKRRHGLTEEQIGLFHAFELVTQKISPSTKARAEPDRRDCIAIREISKGRWALKLVQSAMHWAALKDQYWRGQVATLRKLANNLQTVVVAYEASRATAPPQQQQRPLFLGTEIPEEEINSDDPD